MSRELTKGIDAEAARAPLTPTRGTKHALERSPQHCRDGGGGGGGHLSSGTAYQTRGQRTIVTAVSHGEGGEGSKDENGHVHRPGMSQNAGGSRRFVRSGSDAAGRERHRSSTCGPGT